MQPASISLPSANKRFSAPIVISTALVAAGIGILYWGGLADMLQAWSREEYSHGYIIPILAAYLFVRRLPNALDAAPTKQWMGPVIAVPAVILGLIGSLSDIPDIAQYGFLLSVVAVSVSLFGLRSTMLLWVPLVYLVFMVPFPQIIYLKLSTGLQLLSSQLGVALIRLADISVFLEGNVIDLGVYKLQVVEACSGLRYLFPLMSFGFLFAVLYQGPRWHKLVLFLSTIPITIGMNSFRIAVIGVLVERYGIESGEGFLHFFEGWVIFMACLAILFLEALVLLSLNGSRMTLGDALDLRLRTDAYRPGSIAERGNGRVLALSAGIFILGALLLQLKPDAQAELPARQTFATFPSVLDGWRGRQNILPWDIAEVLGADDYLQANYAKQGRTAGVNLFIAFYEAQTSGRAVHSPEVCIPGDGWEIGALEALPIDLAGGLAGTLTVNRVIVQKGLTRQLVYYWFEQRGRQLTNEYEIKWRILVDGMTRGRTDGSLVRLVTPISENGGEAAADRRLEEFLNAVYPALPDFLPQ